MIGNCRGGEGGGEIGDKPAGTLMSYSTVILLELGVKISLSTTYV